MNEYEQTHLERRIEALMKHLGLRFEERPCPVPQCRGGRLPDSDYCPTCGGLNSLIEVKENRCPYCGHKECAGATRGEVACPLSAMPLRRRPR